ncbi:CD48 antigen-like [Garra rufa]|uniref:CD48 antigen-like n=1 Tax=Garra rufa TaxID=137080 RepID=UPI003CCE9FBA
MVCWNHAGAELCSLSSGISAVTSVFVQTGASVQLDIQELPKIQVFIWKKDKSATIVTYLTETNKVLNGISYEKRVKFNIKTFSMTLINATKSDNGLYTAESIEDSNTFFAEYRISVLDAVDDPDLTVYSNQSSGDSCTVNFTCRSNNLTLNSTYNSGSCSPKEVPSVEINDLILKCNEESIICNHSNPVSWKDHRINIKELCVKGAQMEVVENSTLYAQVEGQKMQNLNSDCHTYDTPNQGSVLRSLRLFRQELLFNWIYRHKD